jgi:16S rRNA (guanine527-N7)-methyltransferase
MRPARIAELLEPFLEASAATSPCHSEPAKAGEEPAFLSPAQLQSISTYIDILIRWNARVNLSAIRDPDQMVTRHFGESLFAARHLFPGSLYGGTAESSSASQGGQVSLADVGSGAGFPGLPIKLWAPHISLTLIESNQKKATFLREVARALTLADINITTSRAEALASGTFDLVTLRAVESFAAILRVAASLVAPAGRLALLIGASQLDPARSALPQFAWSSPKPIPMSRNRILVVAERPF